MSTTRCPKLSAACVLLLLLAAVPASGGGQQPPRKAGSRAGDAATANATRERVVVRVEQFWKAWQERNLHQVFLLFAPSYRKGTTETAFYEVSRGLLNITPVSYKIEKIEVAPDRRRAVAHLDARSVILPFGEVPNKLVMEWVYEQGDWYREMKPQEVIPRPPADR